MTRTPIQLSSMVLLAVILAVGGGLAILSAVDAERDRVAQSLSPESIEPSASPDSAELEARRALDFANVAETRRSARQVIETDSRAALSLAAGEGLALAGTVIEQDGGAPIAGASIVAAGDTFVVEAESGAEGAFELIVPAGSDLPLAVRCAGYAPAQRPSVAPGVPLVIELQREGRIAGAIDGPAREAADGAQVLLFRMNQGSASREPVAETAVDAEGVFGFGELGAGEYQVCVAVEGFAFEFAHGLEVRSGDVCEVSLRPAAGGVLRGFVLYRDSNEPVVGATVSSLPEVQGLAKAVRVLAELSTETGAEGQYELRGLVPGEATITVETAWGGRARGVVVIGEAGAEIERDFTLNAPASLSGRVLTDGGQGAANAHVKVTWEGLKSITAQAEDASEEIDLATARVLITSADINGRYAFAQLPAGRSLHVLAFRGPGATAEVLQADERARVRSVKLNSAEERLNFDVQLEPLTQIAGIVRGRGGERVAGAELRVVYKRSGGKAQLYHSFLESDADGRFEIVGIFPGSYDLFAGASDFQNKRLKIKVLPPPASSMPLEVILEPAERLHGYVVDERGNGVAQAAITAKPQPASNGRYKFQTRTDESGRFELEGMPAGRCTIIAKAFQYRMEEGSAPVVETGQRGPVILEMVSSRADDRCTVVGRISASDRGDLQGLHVSTLNGGVFRRDGTRFEIQGMRPGKVLMTFTAPGYLFVRPEPLKLVPGIYTDIGLIEMHPAAQIELFVRDKDGKSSTSNTLKMTLVRPGGYGQPEKAPQLLGEMRKHRWAGKGKSRKMRALHSEQVPFGTWRLEVRQFGHKPWTRELVFDASHRKQQVEVQLKNDPDARKDANKRNRKNARIRSAKKKK